MRELLKGVAAAGSWAVWVGVFSRSWMELDFLWGCQLLATWIWGMGSAWITTTWFERKLDFFFGAYFMAL
jgi:hypothetical protein